jgi:hypothetical protein
MEDYIKKLNDEIDNQIIVLDGQQIDKKHGQILDFYRSLENRLKELLVYSYYEAIDYNKVIEKLMQEYIDFIDYLAEFILKDRIAWGQTLEEKVEADEPKENEKVGSVQSQLKDEEPKEPIAPKLKPIIKKKKPVKRK